MPSIESFDLWRLEAPLGRMIGDNNCAYDTIGIVALRLRLDDGREGWGYGECCNRGTFTRPAWYIQPMVSLAELKSEFQEQWWPVLQGIDPRAQSTETLRKTHKGVHSYLDAAARQALWDLLAQSHEVPLYQLIGGSAEHNRVRAYGSIVDYPLSEEEVIALTKKFVAQGFKTIKVKVGAPEIERDFRRLEIVREAAGPGIEFTADANEIWTYEVALQRIKAYEDAGYHLGYMEDPLPHQDVEGFQRLTAESPIPIVCHDYVNTIEQVQELLEKKALKRLRVGKDLDFMLACSELAQQHDIPLIFGNSLFEFNVHAAVALPNVDRMEFSMLGWNDLIREPVRFEDSCGIAPEVPGHGLVPKAELLEEWSRAEAD